MRFIAFFIISVSSFFAVTAHAFQQGDGTSTGYGMAQQRQTVQAGVVLSTRNVTLNTGGSVLGERVGASLGGILGFALAKEMTGNIAAQVALGALGGTVGHEVGRQTTSTVSAQELVIKSDDGQIFAVTQSTADGVRFFNGQRIMLIGGGRVAPAY